MPAYLVHVEAPLDSPLGPTSFELRPGLHLVVSDEALSPLYHKVKRALPRGSALLVAPLAAPPKFKVMASGAQAFVRRSFPTSPT